MKPWIVIVAIVLIAAVILTIRAFYEYASLVRTDYEVETEKFPAGKRLRLLVLSDLHDRVYGPENEKLLDLMKSCEPDAILLTGDILTASRKKDPNQVFAFLAKSSKIAPVYYAPGNHERKIKEKKETFGILYDVFRRTLKQNQICYLENEKTDLDENVCLYGLDLDLKYFPKLPYKNKKPIYTAEEMEEDLGKMDPSRYNIILAHSPRYFNAYASSGADLVLSGHYHGGAVRIPKLGGVISPQFVFFPEYDKGVYKKENTEMIVSSGCGSHKVHLRLFNKPEVMVVDIHGHLI
ncbi:MAG: metallophosphoesterase [Lachnospiraceae bacterium]|nr:metallophosphoesterase [Lachnospiraceae bacterium]